MKRAQLTQLLGDAAMAAGLAFHTGEEHTLNGTVRVFPAAWLNPPVVRARSGRDEGEITLRITLHLMALPGAATGGDFEAQWAALETEAMAIATAVASSPAVCGVAGVGCTPARGSLTAHGELSVTLTADVTMWY
jgi:hypothetical protein